MKGQKTENGESNIDLIKAWLEYCNSLLFSLRFCTNLIWKIAHLVRMGLRDGAAPVFGQHLEQMNVCIRGSNEKWGISVAQGALVFVYILGMIP